MDVVLAGGSLGLRQPLLGIIPWALPQVRSRLTPWPLQSCCHRGMVLSRIYWSGGAWGGLCLLFHGFHSHRWVRQQSELARQAQDLEQGPKLDLGFKEGQTIKLNIAVRAFPS